MFYDGNWKALGILEAAVLECKKRERRIRRRLGRRLIF